MPAAVREGEHPPPAPTRGILAPLRIALGLVYFCFGVLKFFPDLSPAEMLAGQAMLHLGVHGNTTSVMRILAGLECGIALLLLFSPWRRTTLTLLFAHLAGTFVPLFVLPELTFQFAPFAPTVEGQYILKNLVFVAAGLALWRDADAWR